MRVLWALVLTTSTGQNKCIHGCSDKALGGARLERPQGPGCRNRPRAWQVTLWDSARPLPSDRHNVMTVLSKMKLSLESKKCLQQEEL